MGFNVVSSVRLRVEVDGLAAVRLVIDLEKEAFLSLI